jgi:hypothetical protein
MKTWAGLLLAALALASAAAAGQDGGRPLVVAAVGDIMLGTDYPENRLADDDGASLLGAAAPLLQGADIAFGNLEGVLLDGGEPAKSCKDPGACYLFRSPTRYADHLRDAGFTALSLANNHARDFGEEGRDASMAALAERGLKHSGREGDFASWEVDGARIALLAFAPFKGANDLLSTDAAAASVAAYAADHDIVIVSMHAGGEAGDVLRVPFAMEEFRGEQRGDVALFARTMVDAGADLVLGHGPHVPRGLEIHRGRLIAYSLGNFATYYGIRVTGNNGLAPLLLATLDRNGRFLEGRVASFRQRRPAGPVPDPSAEAFTLMRRLSVADFPDSAPAFTDDGRLLPRAQSSDAD